MNHSPTHLLTHPRRVAIGCAIATVLLIAGSSQTVAQTKQVATNLRGFGIPFRVNANDDSFIELQLYVSRNQGKSWQFHSRQSTDLEEFPFFADADGEYWFALKTLNRDRRLVPEGDITTPELRIVVDTVKPKLDFRIETDAAGRVACRWKATDANIRPDTLKILYQASLADGVNENAWQAVDVQLAKAQVPRSEMYADQVAWWPDVQAREMSVRLQIEDAAGNVAQADRQVVLPLVAWRKRDISTARPSPLQPTATTQRRTNFQSVSKQNTGNKDGSRIHPPTSKPPGVVCENGVCRLVRKPNVTTSNSAPAKPHQYQSESELYGLAVHDARPQPNRPTTRPAIAARPTQPTPQPARTARATDHRTRTPALPLVGSHVDAVAPPTPAGYAPPPTRRVATAPAAAVAQQSNASAVPWLSETHRWAPRNQSAFGTTMKPDPSLVPQPGMANHQSSTRRRVLGNVPRNPAIQFQQNDQAIAQSSTSFPNNQYQGIQPTPGSNFAAANPPALLPNAPSSQTAVPYSQTAGNSIGSQQRVVTSTTGTARPQPSTSANPSAPNSLGALQNYGGSVYRNSSYRPAASQSRSVVMPSSGTGTRARAGGASRAAIQMISTKRFRLDYAIDAIDPSGVAKVDLWVTQDNGQNWELWGSDPDNASPFPVQMSDEGRYGFRVVIHSRDGLTGRGPSSGDRPDMWVHIDSQPPLTRITSVPYGRSNEAGKLVINYSVSDPFLTLRPNTLSYSRGPDGPWTTIEQGVRNEGRYVWKVEPNVPERLFLRIESIDQAGNVGVHKLSQPIDVSGLVPRGTIRGVVPVK